MNLAEQLAKKTQTVNEENRKNLDLVFEKYVMPRIQFNVDKKQREAAFNSFQSPDEADKYVKSLFPNIGRLQTLIETEMKPYLIEKGFKVGICSPNYYVYIRW